MADLAITERGFVPLWQVTAWPATVAKVAARIAAATEAEAPAPGMISGGAARIGPLVWWLTGEAVEGAASLAEMPAEEGTLLDLGGGRVAFRVEGPRARDLLCRLAPIDFREASFPEGRIVSTVAHLMSVQIARTGEGYDIYVSSSFAGTLRDLLNETAMQWQPAA